MKRLGIYLLILIFMFSAISLFAEKEEAGVEEKVVTPAKAPGKKMVIGYVEESLVPYTEALLDGARIGCEELGFEYIPKEGESKPELIDKYIRGFVAQGVDAILLKPLGGEVLKPAVLEAYKANIPVIYINEKIDVPAAAYIGVNYISGGNMLGELVVKALNGKGKVVHISGDPGGTCATERDEGLYQILDKYPDIKVLDKQFGFWEREQSLVIAERFLTAYPDVDLIACISDLTALGALEAVKEAGKQDQVKIVCFDFGKHMIPYIESGEIYGISFDMPREIARLGVHVAAGILRMEHPSNKWAAAPKGPTNVPPWKMMYQEIHTGHHWVTLENLDEMAPYAF
ncbi:MAG: sugar ABC transporter substrate-binding protein [Thermoplasmata archaeon]|nr:MAG: sugar ABC transporter substrate-binding protein [Thermoplasmata archaeon]